MLGTRNARAEKAGTVPALMDLKSLVKETDTDQIITQITKVTHVGSEARKKQESPGQ